MRLFIIGLLGLAFLCAGAVCATAAEVTLYDTALAEGVWFFTQGDAPEAAIQFRRALEQRPGDGFARYLLGLSLLASGESAEAAKEIAASLEADPPPPVDLNRILADLRTAQLGVERPQVELPEVRKAARRWSGSVSLSGEHIPTCWPKTSPCPCSRAAA